MHGEETGRLCRHEVSGRPARPSRELSIRQVDGVDYRDSISQHKGVYRDQSVDFTSGLP